MPSDDESMVAGSSKEEAPLTDKEKRGLQLPKSRKVNNKTVAIAVVRHAPLTVTGGEAGKKNGNYVNQHGHLRPACCMPCLVALGTAKPTFQLGTQSGSSMILLSCVVDKTYGNEKTCGRCISLNNTKAKCQDPPRQLLNEVRALIKTIPAYNKVLIDNANTSLSDLQGEDKEAVELTIKLALNLGKAYNGYLQENPSVRATPRKRQFADAFMEGKDLAKIADAGDSMKTELRVLSMAISDITKKQRKMIENQEVIMRRLECSRERERYLVDAIQHLNGQLKEGEHWAELEALDLSIADFKSDGDPEPGE